jgi:hypothetical protein
MTKKGSPRFRLSNTPEAVNIATLAVSWLSETTETTNQHPEVLGFSLGQVGYDLILPQPIQNA